MVKQYIEIYNDRILSAENIKRKRDNTRKPWDCVKLKYYFPDMKRIR